MSRNIQITDVASLSPWVTQVNIDNQTSSNVLVLLAKNWRQPSPDEAREHILPPMCESAICSGWLNQPKATLLIRTGLDEAAILRMHHASKVIVKLAPHAQGLTLEFSNGEMTSFANAQAVPGLDTVPMRTRGLSFEDIAEDTSRNGTNSVNESSAETSESGTNVVSIHVDSDDRA